MPCARQRRPPLDGPAKQRAPGPEEVRPVRQIVGQRFLDRVGRSASGTRASVCVSRRQRGDSRPASKLDRRPVRRRRDRRRSRVTQTPRAASRCQVCDAGGPHDCRSVSRHDLRQRVGARDPQAARRRRARRPRWGRRVARCRSSGRGQMAPLGRSWRQCARPVASCHVTSSPPDGPACRGRSRRRRIAGQTRWRRAPGGSRRRSRARTAPLDRHRAPRRLIAKWRRSDRSDRWRAPPPRSPARPAPAPSDTRSIGSTIQRHRRARARTARRASSNGMRVDPSSRSSAAFATISAGGRAGRAACASRVGTLPRTGTRAQRVTGHGSSGSDGSCRAARRAAATTSGRRARGA